MHTNIITKKIHRGVFLVCLAGIVLVTLLACEEISSFLTTIVKENGDGGGAPKPIAVDLSTFKTSYHNTIASGSDRINEIEVALLPEKDSNGNAITYSLLDGDEKYSFKYDVRIGKLYYIGTNIYAENTNTNVFKVSIQASKTMTDQHTTEVKTIAFFITVTNSDISQDDLLAKITTDDASRTTITMDELMLHFKGINKYIPIAKYQTALKTVSTFDEAQTALDKVSKNLSNLYNQDAGELGHTPTPIPDDIIDMDTSKATTMENIFYEAKTFDQAIGNWNVSSVENMSSMFNSAKIFNKDISKWDVSSVTTMTGMFYLAEKFNQDISNWDVSSVQNMEKMFDSLFGLDFDQDISKWDVSKVQNMEKMFKVAKKFDQDLSDWDISALTSAPRMFWGANAMSEANFEATLHGWAQFNELAEETAVPQNVDFKGQRKTMKNATVFYKLQLDHEWLMGSVDDYYGGLTLDPDVKEGSTANNSWDHADAKAVDFSTETTGVTIHALAGDDKIKGGSGDDTIVPGEGYDTITTNGGSDTIMLYFVEDGFNTVTDFKTGKGGDTVNASSLFMTGKGETIDFSDTDIRAKYVSALNDTKDNVVLVFTASGGLVPQEEKVYVILDKISIQDIYFAGGQKAYLDTLIADGNLVLQ